MIGHLTFCCNHYFEFSNTASDSTGEWKLVDRTPLDILLRSVLADFDGRSLIVWQRKEGVVTRLSPCLGVPLEVNEDKAVLNEIGVGCVETPLTDDPSVDWVRVAGRGQRYRRTRCNGECLPTRWKRQREKLTISPKITSYQKYDDVVRINNFEYRWLSLRDRM